MAVKHRIASLRQNILPMFSIFVGIMQSAMEALAYVDCQAASQKQRQEHQTTT